MPCPPHATASRRGRALGRGAAGGGWMVAGWSTGGSQSPRGAGSGGERLRAPSLVWRLGPERVGAADEAVRRLWGVGEKIQNISLFMFPPDGVWRS